MLNPTPNRLSLRLINSHSFLRTTTYKPYVKVSSSSSTVVHTQYHSWLTDIQTPHRVFCKLFRCSVFLTDTTSCALSCLCVPTMSVCYVHCAHQHAQRNWSNYRQRSACTDKGEAEQYLIGRTAYRVLWTRVRLSLISQLLTSDASSLSVIRRQDHVRRLVWDPTL